MKPCRPLLGGRPKHGSDLGSMGATRGWKRGEMSSASSVPEAAVTIVRLGFNVLVRSGLGVGLVTVSRLGFFTGLGALSARSGFGVGLVCTCCLP